jgi:V/A-type H+-transporting ATPase subunit I
MSLRPRPARWFELVTTNVHVAQVLAALAQTGAAELEVRPEDQPRLLLPGLAEQLAVFKALARDYAAYWPPAAHDFRHSGEPREILKEAGERLQAWTAEADPLIERAEALSRERAALALLSDALDRVGPGFPDPARLVGAGPRLSAALVSLPPHVVLPQMAGTVVAAEWDFEDVRFAVLIGPLQDVQALAEQAPLLKGQVIDLPAWLSDHAGDAPAEAARRLGDTDTQLGRARAELDALARQHRLAEALGDFRLFEWLGQHADTISGSSRLSYVNGWTNADSEQSLQRALDARGVSCLVHFLPEPFGSNPPLILKNPPWAKAFEMFARMLGMPARNEADPSMVLAFVAPLIFGFMFGDVGQGLVLIATGIVLGARLPVLRLLVPGGVVAVVFGFLFGSVFCSEEVVHPLWLNPLEEPVTLLAVTLAAGAAIICLGIALDALEAWWRGAARRWVLHEAGFPVAYLSILATFFWSPALWLFALGIAWFLAGAAALAGKGHRVAAAATAAAELVEQMIQILVNTVSFARVGAFALAHAGLSAAVIGVADAVGGLGFWIVLALGNLLVLTLEGLVVGIQTTRLLLFEFFIRFLKGGGREFRPLRPPGSAWLSGLS